MARWLRIRDQSTGEKISLNLRDGVDLQQAAKKIANLFRELSPCLVERCFSFHVEMLIPLGETPMEDQT